MAFDNYGYIYLGLGEEDPAVDRAVIERGGLRTTVVAVPDEAAALDVAKELAEGGAKAIDVCGMVTAAGLARIHEAVGEQVPVGRVVYGIESLSQVAAMSAEDA